VTALAQRGPSLGSAGPRFAWSGLATPATWKPPVSTHDKHHHPCAVGRMTMLPTSTPGGCSTANRMPRAIAAAGMAIASRSFSIFFFMAKSVMLSPKFVAVIPGEISVTR
jgi:hypothetical protein